MDSIVFIAVLVALAIGAFIGWLLGNRAAAAGKQAAESLRLQLDGVVAERDAARADLNIARTALDDERAEHGVTRSSLASQRAAHEERERGFETRLADLRASEEEMKKRMSAQFSEIGSKLLGEAQKEFLERADQRFEQANKVGADRFEKILSPVGDTLERYRKRVEELEKTRSNDFGQLRGVIAEVKSGQQAVIDGAQKIAITLRGASKARGDWGELQFENLLESCGLSDRTDFKTQASFSGPDGALRPDAIINIPGGRSLIVDIKNVFNTYASANEAGSEEQRLELLKAHAREIRGHIDSLSSKRYQDVVDGSADFVIMFIPGEHVLYTALSHDPGLLNYALTRKVVLSSPLNFMSIALTVSTIWRQAGIQADATEIASLGKELYDRLAKVGGLLEKVGNDLSRTNRSFNSVVASFDGRLVPTGRKFEQLSIDTGGAELNALSSIEVEPRIIQHIELENSDAVDDKNG